MEIYYPLPQVTFGNVDAVVEEIVVVRDIVEACWDTVAVGGIVAEDGSIAVHLVKMDVAGHGRVYSNEHATLHSSSKWRFIIHFLR